MLLKIFQRLTIIFLVLEKQDRLSILFGVLFLLVLLALLQFSSVKFFYKKKKTKNGKVEEVDKKIQHEFPPSPFSTTSFLESVSYLGISAARAMSIAEELYMSGLISYPRTDNTVYPS